MKARSDFVAQIHRLGTELTVAVPVEGSRNAFGNKQSNYEEDRTVYGVRTYPNRNTTVETSAGDRTQDRPAFIVATGDGEPDPPESEDRVKYNGQAYEVQSLTEYDTHVEFFGEPVIHDE